MLDTLSQRGRYRVIAVLQVNLTRMDAPPMRCYTQFTTAAQEDVDAYNAYLAEYATLQVGTVQPGDSVLTLSTCQHLSDVDRLVVIATSAHKP